MTKNKRLDYLSALLFIAIAAAVIWVAIPFGVVEPKKVKYLALNPSYYPRLVSYCLLVFGVLLGLRALLSRTQPTATDAEAQAQRPENISSNNLASVLAKLAAVIVLLFLYYWFLPQLGFVLGSMLVLLCLQLLAGERQPIALILIFVVVPASLYVFFTAVAKIPIPSGLLEPWLVG